MKKKLAFLTLLVIHFSALFAQTPINDECVSAIVISDPSTFCSGNGAYTNVGATLTAPNTNPYPDPSCYEASNDVWFTFTALATDVAITVNGASGVSAGGTLIAPEIALYSGFCGSTIGELECQNNANANFVELTQSGITVGSNLLIRIQGGAENMGTFELCIRNFNPPIDPSSDCADAAILCDKSSFVVDQLVGAGNDDTEFDFATCFNNGNTNLEEEFNSVWFKWTCDQSGSLTFTLTPTRPVADLDFVLFELPGGIDDCGGKEIIRCEAAGAPQASFPTPCHGPTGLSFDASDVNENAGCDQNQDSFLAPVDMVSGRSYALGINNFGPGTEGFTIDFGGTGTFLGPKPAFVADPPTIPCLESTTFTDLSTFDNGDIVSWQWNFGEGADPQIADTPGPHMVSYDSWGTKFVTLTVEADEGCIVTEVIPFEVTECCLPSVDNLGAEILDIVNPVCNGDSTGIIFTTGIDGNPFYLYSIDGGPLQGSPTFLGLAAGAYEILVVDRYGCEELVSAELFQPPPIVVEAGPDVTVALGEMTDLNAFYSPVNIGDTIIWSPDSLLSCDNCLDPTALPAGMTTYEITVVDEFGCFDTDSITVFVDIVRPVYIPNAFTPNFDGTNDFFNVFGGPAVDIIENMRIFDRWGDMVYQGTNMQPNNPNEGWDGTFRDKPMNPAVFVYVIDVRFIDGEVLQYSGDLTLLR